MSFSTDTCYPFIISQILVLGIDLIEKVDLQPPELHRFVSFYSRSLLENLHGISCGKMVLLEDMSS